MRAAATGIGSLPYDDIDEAMRLVLGELPDFPHLPELPSRGVGADLVGRTGGAVLAGLNVDLQPAGWRIVDRPSHDQNRARELLSRDLDALEIHGHEYGGPLKLQLCGPWTLAASLELSRGDKVLGDRGAVRDLTASLAEGAAEHIAEVSKRVPGAELVLQLDEPALPMVLAGHVPTASGLRAFGPVDASAARDALDVVLDAIRDVGARTALHCCAAEPPYSLLGRADAVSVDASLIRDKDHDALGELVESGRELWLGLVPSLGPGVPPTVKDLAEPARRLWHRLGFPPERLSEVVVVTPTCGLAGASSGWVRTALGLCRRVAQVLEESPEEPR
ncbi:MAG: hypothetical protein QOJ92_2516 [Frankiales bacterium]|nr:hypothetical protein [Frankiales bacterium]